MNNWEDADIANVLKADIYEPDSYAEAIRTALDQRTKMHSIPYLRWVAAIFIGVLIISGMVYAKPIIEAILHFFNFNAGTDTAIEHGYISEPNITFMTSNNTKITVRNMMMDDHILSFILQMEMDSSIDVSKIDNISIPDFKVKDENGNILYAVEEDKMKDYKEKGNLLAIFKEGYPVDIHHVVNLSIRQADYKNTIDVTLNFENSENYPKSKKLYLSFGQVILNLNQSNITSITGNWNAEIEVPEKFYNREVKVYQVIKCSNPNLNITDFSVYPTETKFEFDAKMTAFYTENMTEEEIEKGKKEHFEWGMNLQHNKLMGNAYIENAEGKRFYFAGSSSEDTKTIYLADGTYQHWSTFSFTQFDMTDTITLHFTMYTKDGAEDVTIELAR